MSEHVRKCTTQDASLSEQTVTKISKKWNKIQYIKILIYKLTIEKSRFRRSRFIFQWLVTRNDHDVKVSKGWSREIPTKPKCPPSRDIIYTQVLILHSPSALYNMISSTKKALEARLDHPMQSSFSEQKKNGQTPGNQRHQMRRASTTASHQRKNGSLPICHRCRTRKARRVFPRLRN